MAFINKIVIVTGAASGLGEAVALKFAKLSARLVLIDKNLVSLNKSADNCEKVSKTKVFRIVANLTRDADIQNIIEKTVKEYGKIDVLINCAGIYKASSIQNPDVMKIYDGIMAINLRALVFITTAATPALIESKGCIINISSVSATDTVTDCLIYGMTKAGVTHFTKSVALELAPVGVRVNSISPGPMKTNLFLHSDTKISQEESDKMWDSLIENTALKRLVKVEDVCNLVSYLASDKAIGITGSDFLIDSGHSLL